MSEKPKPTPKEINEEIIQKIRTWAKLPETLRAIRASEDVALRANKELEEVSKVDPRSLREPIANIDPLQ